MSGLCSRCLDGCRGNCEAFKATFRGRELLYPGPFGEVTAGGIVLPDTAKEKPSQGNVVAVGPGKISDDGVRMDMDVKVGDKVLYGKYSGTDVTLDGDEYLILRESDILAIVK